MARHDRRQPQNNHSCSENNHFSCFRSSSAFVLWKQNRSFWRRVKWNKDRIDCSINPKMRWGINSDRILMATFRDCRTCGFRTLSAADHVNPGNKLADLMLYKLSAKLVKLEIFSCNLRLNDHFPCLISVNLLKKKNMPSNWQIITSKLIALEFQLWNFNCFSLVKWLSVSAVEVHYN